MRAGANDFLVKPIAPDRLLAALNAATDRRKAKSELRPLSEKIAQPLDFDEIVGSAPEFRAAMAIAAKAARARVSVLIEGERSEEHTSELQSLMRISYAVFCLKKKKKTNNISNITLIKVTTNSA